MMELLALLAVYRVSRMIALEDGPYDLFQRARTLVYMQLQSQRTEGLHWIWRGINCPLCISVWAGAVAALLLPWRGLLWYFVTALALSGGATWLYRQERPQ